MFSITKYAKDLNNFNHKCSYDLIYFDAFSPEKQPDLWTEKIFKGLYNNLNYNGILITYCAKGAIKRKLKKIGFQIFAFPFSPCAARRNCKIPANVPDDVEGLDR